MISGVMHQKPSEKQNNSNMKQVEKIWQQLGSQKIDLAKADQIINEINEIFGEVMYTKKQLSNAGFDALIEFENQEKEMRKAENNIKDFAAKAKDLGIDLPKDLQTAEQYLRDIQEGIKNGRKAASLASKV